VFFAAFALAFLGVAIGPAAASSAADASAWINVRETGASGSKFESPASTQAGSRLRSKTWAIFG
jgi:hypothetical protein